MLKVFRDNLKYLSWILWLVIAIFVMFVFVDFGSTVPAGTAAAEAAATVGDQRVSFAEFQNRYRQTEDFYRQAYGDQFTPELARQLRLPIQVLEQLVAEKVLLAEAHRVGLEATDAEVRKRIVSYAAFKNDQGGFIGEEAYNRTLRSSGFTPETFEAQVRREVLVDKLRDIVAHNAYVTEAEVEQALRAESERAAIRYLHLPADRFTAELALSDAEVEAYYQEHEDEFLLPEQRRADYLLVDSGKVRESLTIPEAEVRAYYDAHPDEFTQGEEVRARHILLAVGEERGEQEAQAELEAIRRRIEEGEDFGAVAAQVSEDEGSKTAGGDLGFFGRGRMVKEFEDAAFGAQPGQLVGPIKSAFGLHLLEVQERREAGVRSFEDVKTTVGDRLLAERVTAATEERARQIASRIREEDLASESGLQQLAAEEPSAVYASTPAFGRADLVQGIGRGTAFTAAAFALEPGGVSDPVQIPRGWAVILLKEVLPPRVPPLEEVAAAVRSAVERERGAELAEARLGAARASLAAGATFEDVAQELELEVNEAGPFGPGDPVDGLGDSFSVADAALALDQGQIGGPVAIATGAVLFEVTERQRFDPSAAGERRGETIEALESEKVNQLLASLVDRRRQELKITYNQQLLESLEMEGPGAGTS